MSSSQNFLKSEKDSVYTRVCRYCPADISHKTEQSRVCEQCLALNKALLEQKAKDARPLHPDCRTCGQSVQDPGKRSKNCETCKKSSRKKNKATCLSKQGKLPMPLKSCDCGKKTPLQDGICYECARQLAPRPVRHCLACGVLIETSGRKYCKPCGVEARKESVRIGTARWKLECPDKEKLRCQTVRRNRRAREKTGQGCVTQAQWWSVLEKYQHRCVYCGYSDSPTMDHVVPLSRGGAHSPDNLVPACFRCNTLKGTKLLSEWKPGFVLPAH